MDATLALHEIKQLGYYRYTKFISQDEAEEVSSALLRFADSADRSTLEINYEGSEMRIWNAQLRIPEIFSLYSRLKLLNRILFNDASEFCILAILTKNTPQSCHSNRWHVDSLSAQYKFFLHLSNVTDQDGPFEFIPKSHTVISRLFFCLRYPFVYLRPSMRGIKRAYRSISDAKIPPLPSRNQFLCSSGDLLVADVRMLHRDSPCSADGSRVALHCYLGVDPRCFPGFHS
ncbi:hypothetical protein [Cyanobium sp. L1E-Cus]|uniref:hypothetical protein n=1 Tax=Cyanobium sp. L1E-Cus TaxID=2823714 RepID=UPI0020CF92C7|nr:hypothetical protein [Cyanobium sp. L1E-Cus]MCP9823610.1 hypothetical protein [Cyanobium sp. L1E-Cus]